MISDAHRRLRDATRPEHDRLERRVDILTRISEPMARRALVEGFYSLHRDLEAALAPWLSGAPGLDFAGRSRMALLKADLEGLGGRPPGPESVAVAGDREALGLLYVLEGSTLGGQVIRREARRIGAPMEHLSFLDPYGAEVGPRWRAFLAVVDAHTRSESDLQTVIRGARRGFALAEARLCAERALG
jgi:heme oxygenase